MCSLWGLTMTNDKQMVPDSQRQALCIMHQQYLYNRQKIPCFRVSSPLSKRMTDICLQVSANSDPEERIACVVRRGPVNSAREATASREDGIAPVRGTPECLALLRYSPACLSCVEGSPANMRLRRPSYRRALVRVAPVCWHRQTDCCSRKATPAAPSPLRLVRAC